MSCPCECSTSLRDGRSALMFLTIPIAFVFVLVFAWVHKYRFKDPNGKYEELRRRYPRSTTPATNSVSSNRRSITVYDNNPNSTHDNNPNSTHDNNPNSTHDNNPNSTRDNNPNSTRINSEQGREMRSMSNEHEATFRRRTGEVNFDENSRQANRPRGNSFGTDLETQPTNEAAPIEISSHGYALYLCWAFFDLFLDATEATLVVSFVVLEAWLGIQCFTSWFWCWMYVSNGVVIHVTNIINLFLNDVEIICPILSVETSISLYDCNSFDKDVSISPFFGHHCTKAEQDILPRSNIVGLKWNTTILSFHRVFINSNSFIHHRSRKDRRNTL